GIELRIGIVMIYCIGIGLAVDDSIHIFSRYVQLKRQRPEWTPEQRLRRTVRTTGSALLISSVVLTVGSLCYLMADFRSLRELGLLLSAIVVTALVADLYLLPLLIRWLGPGPVSPDQTKEAAPRSGPSASGPPDP
ncbi:MAG: MMPL family transporter, partial [Phycisphaeraceae bacterium]|nr:MMPL family transporter [Phycisphaeraceae bacterium]